MWRYNTSSGLTVFTYLVDLTVVAVAIPYFMSAIAQLAYLVSRRRRVQGWALARDLVVAGTSVLFSMWVTFASAKPANQWTSPRRAVRAGLNRQIANGNKTPSRRNDCPGGGKSEFRRLGRSLARA